MEDIQYIMNLWLWNEWITWKEYSKSVDMGSYQRIENDALFSCLE